jgi:hypothetical protein
MGAWWNGTDASGLARTLAPLCQGMKRGSVREGGVRRAEYPSDTGRHGWGGVPHEVENGKTQLPAYSGRRDVVAP